MSSASEHLTATMQDIGPREEQQDRSVAYFNDSDRSWVIAVFDGLGGHAGGAEAAQAAADAIPARIGDAQEMIFAVQQANSAVRALGADKSKWEENSRFVWGLAPATTIAVAAWTPQNGLQAAWVGDSVLFFVPVKEGAPGLHSQPQGSWDSPVMDNALGLDDALGPFHIGTMSQGDLDVLNACIDNDGLLAIAATDGLFDPLRLSEYGERGRFSDEPRDNSLGFAIPAEARSSAYVTAAALMTAACAETLNDNAAVAVALAKRA